MPLYLLDTNLLVHYVRDSPLARKVEAAYRLTTGPDTPLISIVTEAEMGSLALQFGWGSAKVTKLAALLAKLRIIPIDRPELIDAFAQIDFYSKRIGRLAGENDMWVAATAYATTATVLTTDYDFDHLDPAFLTRIWIDPKTR